MGEKRAVKNSSFMGGFTNVTGSGRRHKAESAFPARYLNVYIINMHQAYR